MAHLALTHLPLKRVFSLFENYLWKTATAPAPFAAYSAYTPLGAILHVFSVFLLEKFFFFFLLRLPLPSPVSPLLIVDYFYSTKGYTYFYIRNQNYI